MLSFITILDHKMDIFFGGEDCCRIKLLYVLFFQSVCSLLLVALLNKSKCRLYNKVIRCGRGPCLLCPCCWVDVCVRVHVGGGDYRGTQGEQTERGLDCLVYSDKLRGSLLSVQ